MEDWLEAVRQWGRRLWPYLQWLLLVLIVLAAIWALIYVPKMQVPVCPPDQMGLPTKVCFDIENEARKTLAYIMGGLLAIIGITLALRRIRALERQVLVAQEGQITERFTRAIDQLGSKEIAIRIGGIYALESIAWDSDIDYWPIMETLTAYVRERVPWREPPPDESGGGSGEEAAAPEAAATEVLAAPKPATDIQAILTVLGRRKYQFEQGETENLDLRGTDLRGAEFRGANLVGAVLVGANLEGAILTAARLEGTNLFKVIGLTREQLAEAIIDKKTFLPDYLYEERPEDPGSEGNDEE